MLKLIDICKQKDPSIDCNHCEFSGCPENLYYDEDNNFPKDEN